MQPGDVLAFEVANSTWVALRVLAGEGDERCVVLSRWSGPRGTRLATLRRAASLFELQPTTHHQWSRPALGGWVRDPLPASVQRLGRVALRRGEAERVVHPSAWVNASEKTQALARRVLPLASWDQLLEQVRKQWRWEHDREALLRDEASAQVERVAALQDAIARQAEAQRKLDAAGLPGLARQRFLPAWKSEKPAAVHRAAERLLRETARQLAATPAKGRARCLRETMAGFNALHARFTFDAADAEDVMEAVGRLARAAALRPAQLAALDALRDF